MAPQEYAPPPKHNKVELIPWDPNSAAHFQRLYEQRVACTWDQHLVGEWKAKVLEGNKFLYWIVRVSLRKWKSLKLTRGHRN